jgi:hypothetical protein
MSVGDQASSKDAGRNVLGLWMVLVTILLLLGVAGAGSFALLQQVTRMPTAADIAQRVCTAYTTQNYQLLINQIDPTPVAEPTTTPGEISSNGSFDTTAQNQLISTLKGLDKSAGIVTSCHQRQIVFTGSAANPGSVQFVFLMQRAGTSNGTSSGTYSSLMNFVQHSDTWMVARDSNFIGTLQ